MNWTGRIDPIAFTFNIGSRQITVAWYGIILTLAMVTALVVCIQRGKKHGLVIDDYIELFIICIPLAIIGARLGFVAIRPEYYVKPDFSWSDFVRIFDITEGGMTIMTGVPFGVLGGLIWAKVRKVDFIAAADIILPVVLLAQGLGRWGNFMNQEIYGALINNPNAQWFPLAVYIVNGRSGAGYYQATFFYEMVLDIGFFIAMIMIQKRLRLKGSGILMYIMSYTFIRFNMSFMRDGGPSNSVVMYNMIFTGVTFLVTTALFVYRIITTMNNGEIIWFKNGVAKEDLITVKRKGLSGQEKREKKKEDKTKENDGLN